MNENRIELIRQQVANIRLQQYDEEMIELTERLQKKFEEALEEMRREDHP